MHILKSGLVCMLSSTVLLLLTTLHSIYSLKQKVNKSEIKLDHGQSRPMQRHWLQKDVYGVQHINDATLLEKLSFEPNFFLFLYSMFNNGGKVNEQFGWVAKQINATRLPVAVAAFCTTMFIETSNNLELHAPSVVFFRKFGTERFEFSPFESNKRNESEQMFEWLRSKLGSPALHVNSIDELKTFIQQSDRSVLLGAFSSEVYKNKNSSEIREFIKLAEIMDNAEYAITFNEKLRKHFKLEEIKNMLIFKKESPRRLKYQGPWNMDAMHNWAASHSRDNVSSVRVKVLSSYESSSVKYNIYLFLLGSDPLLTDILTNFSLPCGEYKETMRCYWVNMNKKEFNTFARQNGVRMGPTFHRLRLIAIKANDTRIHYREDGAYFIDALPPQGVRDVDLLETYSVERVRKFIDKLDKQKATRFYITEGPVQMPADLDASGPALNTRFANDVEDEFDKDKDEEIPPEEDHSGHILISQAAGLAGGTPKWIYKVVGQSFNSFIKNTNKTSVIYFTAGWCLACNHTIYTRLTQIALHFGRQGRRDIQFGYSDYSSNEYPGLRNTQMPGIKMFLGNSNEQLHFAGNETYRDIKAYIESNGKLSAALPNTPRDIEDIDNYTNDFNSVADPARLKQKLNKSKRDEL